jgi:branched-chain amino acid transport system substrate-binding protein
MRKFAACFLIVVVLMSLFVSFGCGKQKAVPGEQTLKIGALLSLTGPGSFWGIAWQDAINMAVDEINSAGGFTVGGTTYKLDVVYYDDKYTATEAVAGITKFIEEDNVKYVIGPLGSAAMIAIAPIAEQNNVLILGAGSTPDRLGPDKPHIFAMDATAKEMQPAIDEWVTENYPEAKTWYGIVPNNETGWSDIQVCGPRIEALGWQILGWELYDPATTDFYPSLTKIMAKNPDMIDVGASIPGSMSLIWKQLGELGYQGLKLSFSGMSPQALLTAAGTDGVENGIMGWFDFNGQYILDTEKEFMTKIAAYTGKQPGVDFDALSAIWTYDSVEILVEAMKGAQSLDPTVLADYIPDMQYQAPNGLVTFGGEKTFGIKHMAIQDIMVGYWENGEYHNAERVHPEIP